MSYFNKFNHNLITPSFLKAGDKIAVVAPSRWVTEDEMKPALTHLTEWGMQVVVLAQVYSHDNQFAGSDNERASTFQQVLDDPSIKAIICARGGYGSVKLLPKLNFRNFLKNPKWIIGFSDITALHSHINTNIGVKTIHAPMAVHFKDEPLLKQSFKYLQNILLGHSLSYIFVTPALSRQGEAKGVLCGGNLSVLQSLRGTPADINPEGRILFIEDVDEYLYHIDRMIFNLRYGGILQKLNGLILGAFSEMKDNTTPFGMSSEEIILQAVGEYSYPVITGFQAGHVKENYPLILGSQINININQNTTQIQFL